MHRKSRAMVAVGGGFKQPLLKLQASEIQQFYFVEKNSSGLLCVGSKALPINRNG